MLTKTKNILQFCCKLIRTSKQHKRINLHLAKRNSVDAEMFLVDTPERSDHDSGDRRKPFQRYSNSTRFYLNFRWIFVQGNRLMIIKPMKVNFWNRWTQFRRILNSCSVLIIVQFAQYIMAYTKIRYKNVK